MSNYQVKSVEPVVVGTDIQVRVFTLADGDVIPWHYHSESTDHYFVLRGQLQGDEIRALRRLQREQEASPYVFPSERGGPMSAKSFGTLFERLGKRAGMPFTIFPHMLRHACGYALAGHDTCRHGSGTKTSSTRCATPSWRRIGSRISGDRAPRDATRFRTIQVSPKDLRALPRHPGPAVSWHSGFRGGAHARSKTTPVHHAARRRSCVATRGACAAADAGSGRTRERLGAVQGRVCSGFERGRLCRRPERARRISLGGRRR